MSIGELTNQLIERGCPEHPRIWFDGYGDWKWRDDPDRPLHEDDATAMWTALALEWFMQVPLGEHGIGGKPLLDILGCGYVERQFVLFACHDKDGPRGRTVPFAVKASATWGVDAPSRYQTVYLPDDMTDAVDEYTGYNPTKSTLGFIEAATRHLQPS